MKKVFRINSFDAKQFAFFSQDIDFIELNIVLSVETPIRASL